MADPLKSSPSQYVLPRQTSSSVTKGVHIEGTPKIGEYWGLAPWGEGTANSLKTSPYLMPNMCYNAEFGRSRSNSSSIIKEICLKNVTPRIPPFQGHSKLSEPT